MPYSGPGRLELLVLITKYNKQHPKDKIKPQLTKTLTSNDAQMVDEYIAQQTALRAQYPYNDFQKQAQKLQPLLQEVTNLSHYTSYEEVKWMDLLVAVNEMLKQVRSKWAETEKIRKWNQQKAGKDLAEKKALIEAKAKKEEHKRAEKEKAVVKAVEQAGDALLQKDQQPKKLQKKPNLLAYPVQEVKQKEIKVEKEVAESASPAPPLPLRRRSQNVVQNGPGFPLQIPEVNDQQVPAQFPVTSPQLLPCKDSPTEDPAKPITPPVRPALATGDKRSSDGPKKKVSFEGPKEDLPKPKEEDPIMTGMDAPAMPGAWQDSTPPILSTPLIVPEDVLPEENAPKRKKGTEPERHQAKMDKAHYDALRVASEINKFSWPGEGRK
ncbi:hypothetical protein IFR05_003443 [Cadophora sp. M221]|nr:hypothetical protein IFR05_003443 [Cadophora sp. M221]